MQDKKTLRTMSCLALASDHAGYRYKEAVKEHLQRNGFAVKDFGAFSEEMCDYPCFIRPAARSVAAGEAGGGIVLGGSGNGEAMAANKIPGVRCAVCWNPDSARLAKEHNNANVIALGQRMMSLEAALAIVDAWLGAVFQQGRHLRRIKQLEDPDLCP